MYFEFNFVSLRSKKLNSMETNDKYFLLDNNPIYNSTVFSRFFKENNPLVMKWAENVLAKVSGSNILPKFIEKGGKDFQSFWEQLHICLL